METYVVVALRDMSEGNAVAGTTWQKTKIFKSDDPIEAIVAWARGTTRPLPIKCRLQITVPDGQG